MKNFLRKQTDVVPISPAASGLPKQNSKFTRFFRQNMPVSLPLFLSISLLALCLGTRQANSQENPGRQQAIIRYEKDSLSPVISQNSFSLDSAYSLVLEKASSSSVLLLGESHEQKKMNYFMAGLIPELAKQGYTHLVLEIPRKYQADVDNYVFGNLPDSLLEQKLSVLANPHFELLKAAKGACIQVICAGNEFGSIETEQERFDFIMSKLPNGARVIVNFGRLHLSYASSFSGAVPIFGVTYPTIGRRFQLLYGEKSVWSVCFNNLDFLSMLPGWKTEGGMPALAFPKSWGYEVYNFSSDFNMIINIEQDGVFAPKEK